MARAFLTFFWTSLGYDTLAVAEYGMPWAAMISGIGFLGRALPKLSLPHGEVVVEAYLGVAPDRWMPVFM